MKTLDFDDVEVFVGQVSTRQRSDLSKIGTSFYMQLQIRPHRVGTPDTIFTIIRGIDGSTLPKEEFCLLLKSQRQEHFFPRVVASLDLLGRPFEIRVLVPKDGGKLMHIREVKH